MRAWRPTARRPRRDQRQAWVSTYWRASFLAPPTVHGDAPWLAEGPDAPAGTRVKVTTAGRSQIDEVMSGSGYYSQNDLRLHFGLGRATGADSVEIAWPSGGKETFRDLAANQVFVIQEGKGIVSARKPG